VCGVCVCLSKVPHRSPAVWPCAVGSRHPQALHHSEINFKIESFYDGIWTATLGDQMNGRDNYSRRPNYIDALLDLKDMAIERYPDSAFARTYRGVRFVEKTDYAALSDEPIFT
jgi:hypothetical protein